ncbi:TAXI family TRAP transporter solute-binding subunit [Granulosicoccus sp. 3-233]|uniref:TAXI family TRAP transporter solute-binding subunit n=1 Tax=Granulosicoccus sp. 3-233 TaxID=3417969 RepID=UPI003D34BD82
MTVQDNNPAKLDSRRRFRRRFKTLLPSLGVYGGTAVLIAAALWISYQFIEPAPPDTLVMATGNREGAYHAFAMQLSEEFAKEGVTLQLRETAGSVENLALLEEDSDVKVAFLQSGIASAAEHPQLRGLASVDFEPLWLFSNQQTRLRSIGDLKGLRVAVGAPGSGTRQVALKLLADNALTDAELTLLPLTGSAAVDALLDGSIDAALTISSANAGMVQRLLAEPDVRLMSVGRAEAYARRYSWFSHLTLPRGVIDLAQDRPPETIDLIAVAATLVASDDLHPALADLMMRAAASVAARDTLFSRAGRFPSRDFLDFPVSADAERYYKYGVPFLLRYLPFWAANLVDRLKLLALPLLALLLPLSRMLPPAYRWTVRKKVYHWYDEVQAIDQSTSDDSSPAALSRCLLELKRIEDEARAIEVPLSYAHELYALRQHIDMLTQQIERRQEIDVPA